MQQSLSLRAWVWLLSACCTLHTLPMQQCTPVLLQPQMAH
jgi:hypothetical protein